MANKINVSHPSPAVPDTDNPKTLAQGRNVARAPSPDAIKIDSLCLFIFLNLFPDRKAFQDVPSFYLWFLDSIFFNIIKFILKGTSE